jgi:predicted Zn-dependent protease
MRPLVNYFRGWKLAISTIIFCGALVSSGCNEGTFKNHYSTSQEISMGKRENDEIVHSQKMDYDPVLNARVQRIASPIFEQAQLMRSDVVYKIAVIDSPEVNAFSIPGGWIYLYTGLINKVGTDDDALACIIGHETAHVVRRHVVKQMSDEDVKGALVSILGLATANYTVYNTADTLFQMDQLHFSREDEYEADKYGLMFAYNAGYDPEGMIRFFSKLEKLEKGEQDPAYMEDHPLTRNRIDRAKALIKELRANSGHYPDDVDSATAAAAQNVEDQPSSTNMPPSNAGSGSSPSSAETPVIPAQMPSTGGTN